MTIFVLISFAIQLNGQGYHPLIRTGACWDNATYVSMAVCYTSASRTEFLPGDSLRDGMAYRLMNEYPFLGTPSPGGTICAPFTVSLTPARNALLREDTLSRKVFIHDVLSEQHDQLLYDFSLQAGDTLEAPYTTLGGLMIVDHVADTLLQNGETRKIFCFDPACSIYYLESVGGWQGLTQPIAMGLGWGGVLLCSKNGSQPMWGNQCNYQFVGLDSDSPDGYRIGPNPAVDHLIIENMDGMPFPSGAEIKLLSLTGTIIRSGAFPAGQTSVNFDLTGIRSGLYICVIDSRPVQTRHKIIVLSR